MKLYNPVLVIKIDKDIADYLNGAYLEGGSVVFLIALDYVAKIKVISKVAKQSGLYRVKLCIKFFLEKHNLDEVFQRFF